LAEEAGDHVQKPPSVEGLEQKGHARSLAYREYVARLVADEEQRRSIQRLGTVRGPVGDDESYALPSAHIQRIVAGLRLHNAQVGALPQALPDVFA
jgi:hypothetical protein